MFSSTLTFSVVVASLPNTPPVDEGTVLWTKDKTSIAKVRSYERACGYMYMYTTAFHSVNSWRCMHT